MLLFPSGCGWERWAASFVSTVHMFVPFHASPPTLYHPFPKFSFRHSGVSTTPRNWVPPRVLAHLPNLCVVCRSVNVYWLPPFAHTSRNSLFDLQLTSTHAVKYPLCLSVGLSFLERNGPPFPHLTIFREESALDTSMTRSHKHYLYTTGTAVTQCDRRDQADIDINRERDVRKLSYARPFPGLAFPMHHQR